MVFIMGQNKTNQLITSSVINNGTQCWNSTHFNSTHLCEDSNINTAAVYRAEDFAAMAVVFTVVFLLSLLWQYSTILLPFCCPFLKKNPVDEPTDDDVLGFNGIQLWLLLYKLVRSEYFPFIIGLNCFAKYLLILGPNDLGNFAINAAPSGITGSSKKGYDNWRRKSSIF